MSAVPPPGRYRHFKGDEYEVIGVATHSETEEPLVLYRALRAPETVWARPLSMWSETVDRGAGPQPRFAPIE